MYMILPIVTVYLLVVYAPQVSAYFAKPAVKPATI
jgi:hypothetical protein